MMTYWRRVRYDSDIPPWDLCYDEHKGYYAIANRDFAPGDHICTEFPVLWVEGHHPFDDKQIANLIEKVGALPEEDKEAYYAMANVYSSEEFHPAVGIFMTNCFDMTDSIFGTCSAMYLALARLNHSCVPNAQQTHLPETTEEVLYASRLIKAGEEINDCYIDLRQTRRSRQQDLLEHYRFACMCDGCVVRTSGSKEDRGVPDAAVLVGGSVSDSSNSYRDESTLKKKKQEDNTDIAHKSTITTPEMLLALRQADDKARVLASTILDSLTLLIEEDFLDEALHKALTAHKTLFSAENTHWSVRYLSELSMCIYTIADCLGDEKKKKKFLGDAHHWNVLLTGHRSEETKRTASLLEELCQGTSR